MTVRAIVLSGGGVKGAFQVGALQAAFDQHPHLVGDAWFGVSTGNLTAALCAQSATRAGQREWLRRAEAIYLGISGNGDIYRGSRWWPLMALRAWRGAALFDPSPLRALIRREINPDKLAGGAAMSCGTVELGSGGYVRFDGADRDNIHAAILASASMPVYFPPVEIEGGAYIDGGLRNQTPLKDAVDWLKYQSDPDKEVWVFLASPRELHSAKGPWTKTLEVAKRSLGIALHEIYVEDIASLRAKNVQAQAPDSRYSLIRHVVVAPTVGYGDALDFNPATIRRMLADGRALTIGAPHA